MNEKEYEYLLAWYQENLPVTNALESTGNLYVTGTNPIKQGYNFLFKFNCKDNPYYILGTPTEYTELLMSFSREKSYLLLVFILNNKDIIKYDTIITTRSTDNNFIYFFRNDWLVGRII